ncbi:MAG TPA: peptide ABC transporter substrate-binding protein [Thermomicrobiales bacterium]|nr:peptide ABC transporter substrate-binding protein [Thermomicrobiales bacterium]
MEQNNSRLDLLREEILNGKLNRRTVLKRAMLMGLSAPVIAGLLAACGGDDDDGDDAPEASPTTGSSAEATEAPEEEEGETPEAEATEAPDEEESPEAEETEATGTDAPAGQGRGVADLLKILYWQAPTILNTHFSQGTKDSAAASLVLEPLIDIAADGSLVPVLAAEIPSLENGGVAEDGLSVTYTLREGVMWSDGEPFTANDVVFTWEYASDEAATTTSIAAFDSVENVEAVDDLTVRITFTEPNPGWYSVFATAFTGGTIVPRHILESSMGAAARDAEFNLNPIGTGPYKVAEFRPGDVIMYEINENYREADKPYFKTVEFKGGGDAAAAARAALESGETDWAWNLQVEKSILEPMAEGSDIGTLVNTPGVNVERILVNFADPNTEVEGARSEPSTQHPFLSDLAVRQAFALACDRDTIASELYGPAGSATANLLVAPANFASPNTTYEYDPEAGAAMLEEAGWTGSPRAKDGVEMSVIYQTTINPLRQKTQEIVKQGWDQMGVATELKSIDASVFFASDAGNPDTASHFYADFQMFTNGPSSPYPIAYMASWVSRDPAVDLAQQSNAWAGSNTTRWVNEEFNELYTQALTELDPATQEELFVGMNDLVANEVAEIGLVHRSDVVAAANRLKGYEPSPWTTDVRDIANWYFEE